MGGPHIILASSSPRRRELLSLLAVPFEIRAAHIDETPYPNEPPHNFVRRMAREKTESLIINLPATQKIRDQRLIIIAADTTVTIDGQILNKPTNAAEARNMLQQLRGRTHQVLSALVVARVHTSELIEEFCASDVPMRNYTDEELAAYVASGDPLDKAGAYAIQHQGFHPVENFAHCFASVMGLPLCHLARALKRSGMTHASDVPLACQQFNQYPCPIYQDFQI